MSFPLCHITFLSSWLLSTHPPLCWQRMWSPGDVAMPVRAKLLAAGSATCAYRIAAKAVAFPDCPALGNWKVTHSEGCWGWLERGLLSGLPCKDRSVKEGFKWSSPLFLPLHGTTGLRGSPRDFWVKSLACRWAKTEQSLASRPRVERHTCPGCTVEDSYDLLWLHKMCRLPFVSALFCLVISVLGFSVLQPVS